MTCHYPPHRQRRGLNRQRRRHRRQPRPSGRPQKNDTLQRLTHAIPPKRSSSRTIPWRRGDETRMMQRRLLAPRQSCGRYGTVPSRVKSFWAHQIMSVQVPHWTLMQRLWERSGRGRVPTARNQLHQRKRARLARKRVVRGVGPTDSKSWGTCRQRPALLTQANFCLTRWSAATGGLWLCLSAWRGYRRSPCKQRPRPQDPIPPHRRNPSRLLFAGCLCYDNR